METAAEGLDGEQYIMEGVGYTWSITFRGSSEILHNSPWTKAFEAQKKIHQKNIAQIFS